MTTYYLGSQSITNWDTVPIIAPTRGQGAGDKEWRVDDYVALTANFLNNAGSTARILRFPTSAMIKRVTIAVDNYLDSHSSPGLVLDFNIAFSDANTTTVSTTGAAGQGLVGDGAFDGTPSSVAGEIPTSANTGAVTAVGTYSSPNILFGQYAPTSTSAKLAVTDITFPWSSSLVTNGTFTFADMQLPLWDVFGFVNQAGIAADPGGYFELMAYVSTAATTSHAGNLWAEITYSL